MTTQQKESIFEQHPRKTALGILFVLGGMLYLVFHPKWFNNSHTEYENRSLKTILTQYYFSRVIENNVGRFIKLREHEPNKSKPDRPSRNYVKNIPGHLERCYYPMDIESNGFIAPSAVNEQPDIKIVFLGGSTTECKYMDANTRFPYLVGRLLEDKLGRKVNSYNGGVSANESMHSINILLNKVLPMKPDMVVMMHNINDLVMLRLHGDYYYPNSLKSHLQTAENVFTRVEYPKAQTEIDEAKIVQAFQRNMNMFISICQLNQVQPVLMTQANRVEDDKLYQRFNQVIRDTASIHDILLIDLDKGMPRTLEVMYDHYHYTKQGSKQSADIIASHLLNILKTTGRA